LCRNTEGLTNINVHVEDYADFCSERSKLHGRKFSRVFGIETVEHSRNIPGWSARFADVGICVVVCCSQEGCLCAMHAFSGQSSWLDQSMLQ
jgi:hypothetical protein